ncbi:MAG: hypothetical protein LBK83_14490 [Treponema sp.]|jgi:hypothetical protein|nr:hypothetical protein [Treponema sp.]
MPSSIHIRPQYSALINSLWNKAHKEAVTSTALQTLLKRGAYIQEKIPLGGLLFIGIGASWGKNKKDTCAEDGIIQYEKPEKLGTYPYYVALMKLAEDNGLPFAHIDLTLFRETSQAALKSLLASFPDVFEAHYNLAFDLIQKARPRIIVVNNAFVSHFLQNDEKGFFPSRFDTAFDKTIGTCRIKQPLALDGTPIFFSGMLTGQHALDEGSKQRLSWHIAYVLKKINSIRSKP